MYIHTFIQSNIIQSDLIYHMQKTALICHIYKLSMSIDAQEPTRKSYWILFGSSCKYHIMSFHRYVFMNLPLNQMRLSLSQTAMCLLSWTTQSKRQAWPQDSLVLLPQPKLSHAVTNIHSCLTSDSGNINMKKHNNSWIWVDLNWILCSSGPGILQPKHCWHFAITHIHPAILVGNFLLGNKNFHQARHSSPKSQKGRVEN